MAITLRPVRSVYGTPWSRMARGVPLSRSVMNKLGRILVQEIVREGKKDFAKQGRKATPLGEPEGIPKSRNFWKSFKHEIKGSRTIQIISDWEWIEQILEGRDPYPMPWLTQERGIMRVPMKQPNGTVIVRVAPATVKDAWIHPGFAKHNFVERGVKKGREKAAEIIAAEVAKMLANGDPTK